MKRSEGRAADQHRAVEMITGFHRNAEGSVLYRTGGTAVLCAASISEDVPRWFGDRTSGWITAEYQMHPRSGPTRREAREGRDRPPKGRTHEIQRLVGRALRAAIDLDQLGRRTITLDCDVLEADGGTRTASITGSFVALALALDKLGLRGAVGKPVLRDQVAAISVGLHNGQVLVDLDYQEDHRAQVDMNVVATASGQLVEVQATAEGRAIEQATFLDMLAAALRALESLVAHQREALRAATVDVERLLGGGGRQA